MAYDGEILDQCGVIEVTSPEAEAVIVSGQFPNKCGHVLFYTPSGGGYYLHVPGDWVGYPKYMTPHGFSKYIKDHGKTILNRKKVTLSNPNGVTLFLEECLSKKWKWKVLPDNCVTFVESMMKAGGGDWGLKSNCPIFAKQDIGPALNLASIQV